MHTKPSYNVVFITPAVKAQDKRLLCCRDPIMPNAVIVCVQVSGISDRELKTVFTQWDPQGTLLCNSHLNSSHPVYIVQTTGGDTAHKVTDSVRVSLPLSLISSSLLLSDCRGRLPRPPQWPPKRASATVACHNTAGHSELSWFVTTKQYVLIFKTQLTMNTLSISHNDCIYKSAVSVLEGSSDVLWDINKVENISQVGKEMNSSSRRGNVADIEEELREISVAGVLNPTTCLHLGDIILFTVDTRHYPQYDQ